MMKQQSLLTRGCVIVLVAILLFQVVDAGRKNKGERTRTATSTSGPTTADEDMYPDVPFLIEWIGRELYAAVNRPKYKFYIYMTVGKMPAEHSTIAFLSTLCNILYGTCVLLGFILLPRGFMLASTLATLYIGPALVLILLGTIGVVLTAFALYPVLSVSAVWLLFFSTSHLAQTIGQRLGLDHDGDGDVDLLDLLDWIAQSTRLGKFLRLDRIHEMLNESFARDPFKALHQQLNDIQRETRDMKVQQIKLQQQSQQQLSQQQRPGSPMSSESTEVHRNGGNSAAIVTPPKRQQEVDPGDVWWDQE